MEQVLIVQLTVHFVVCSDQALEANKLDCNMMRSDTSDKMKQLVSRVVTILQTCSVPPVLPRVERRSCDGLARVAAPAGGNHNVYSEFLLIKDSHNISRTKQTMVRKLGLKKNLCRKTQKY